MPRWWRFHPPARSNSPYLQDAAADRTLAGAARRVTARQRPISGPIPSRRRRLMTLTVPVEVSPSDRHGILWVPLLSTRAPGLALAVTTGDRLRLLVADVGKSGFLDKGLRRQWWCRRIGRPGCCRTRA